MLCVRLGVQKKKKISEKAWIYTETVTKDNRAILFAFAKLWNYMLRSLHINDKSQGITKAKNPDNWHSEHLTARVSLQKAQCVISDNPFEDSLFEPHYYTKFFMSGLLRIVFATVIACLRIADCIWGGCFTWTLILSRFQFLHSFCDKPLRERANHGLLLLR